MQADLDGAGHGFIELGVQHTQFGLGVLPYGVEPLVGRALRVEGALRTVEGGRGGIVGPQPGTLVGQFGRLPLDLGYVELA